MAMKSKLDIAPPNVHFILPYNHGQPNAPEIRPFPLTLRNPYESVVAYKIKTNAHARYLVKPVMGTIPPFGAAAINIRLNPEHALPTDQPDLFLLQTCFIASGTESLVDANFWKGIDKTAITQVMIASTITMDHPPLSPNSAFVIPSQQPTSSGSVHAQALPARPVTAPKGNPPVEGANKKDAVTLKSEIAEISKTIASLRTKESQSSRMTTKSLGPGVTRAQLLLLSLLMLGLGIVFPLFV